MPERAAFRISSSCIRTTPKQTEEEVNIPWALDAHIMNEVVAICVAVTYSSAINSSVAPDIFCTTRAESHHLSSLALLGTTFHKDSNFWYHSGKNSQPAIHWIILCFSCSWIAQAQITVLSAGLTTQNSTPISATNPFWFFDNFQITAIHYVIFLTCKES